jgi:N-hydroxyarylamine O-acetyltransferase
MLPEIEQPCAGGPMRLLPFDGALTLQARFDDVWRDLYRFTLEPHFAADFEIANWFTSTHPQSLFRNHLVIERATPEVRISAVDRRVRRWFAHGRVEEFTIADAAGLAAVLTADFGLEPPVDAATIFARLPAERA